MTSSPVLLPEAVISRSSPSPNTKQKWFESRVLLWSLILGASLMRIFVCLQHNPQDYLFSDPHRHWLNGERILSPDLMGASDPILYQIYIFFVRWITQDHRVLFALSTAFLSVIMPWTYYRAGRELGFNKTTALWGWALIALCPSLFTIYHYVMMETLLLPLIGVALWMTGRSIRRNTTQSWLIAVGIWMLCFLCKPTVVPLGGVCLLCAWWVGAKKCRRSIFAIVVVTLMAIPSGMRSMHYLGFFAPLGNPWITKIQHASGTKEIRLRFNDGGWLFASPSAFIRPLEPLSDWMIARTKETTPLLVLVKSSSGAEDWKRSYETTKEGWLERTRHLLENIVLFVFGPSWPDGHRGEWDGWLSYHSRWIWLPVLIFVLECNLVDFWNRKFEILSLATTGFAVFLMFQNVATTEGRYRKALEPVLILNLVSQWSAVLGSQRNAGKQKP